MNKNVFILLAFKVYLSAHAAYSLSEKKENGKLKKNRCMSFARYSVTPYVPEHIRVQSCTLKQPAVVKLAGMLVGEMFVFLPLSSRATD